MTTIIPYFDPILGKLRNSDVALISLATLVVSDPLIVNNLIVNSNASINQLHTNAIYNVSTISTNAIGVNTVQWNSNTSYAPIEGQMAWASKSGTVELGLAGGNVGLEVGLQTMLPRRVRNSTGSTIPKGTAVYLNGVSGNTPLISRAIATGDQTSAFTIGMTAEDIANNNTGWVTSFGALQGLNLSSFTSGDTLYLSGATAGYYTNVPTRAPIHYVRIGTVTKATTDGELIVNVINGYELDELHNVVISSLASGQIIQSGASSLWYNRSLASAVADFISIPSIPSLGSLAVMNQLSYASLTGKPSLGSLAEMNALSFTSLLNQPSLSSLAFQATIDYTSNQLTNKPSLGSLAQMNQLSFTSLTNQPSLSSLAFQSTVDYPTQVLNKPSLGSLANMNQLSFTSLTNQPSLSSLAFQATIDYNNGQILNKPALGSLAVMNQLSFTSLTNQPSLGSLAFQNVVSLGSLAVMNQLSFTSLTNQPSLGSLAYLSSISQIHLPSSASFAILNTQGIVNASTVSTNRLNTNQLFASTASIGNLTLNNITVTDNVSANSGGFTGYLSASNLAGYNTGDQVLPIYGDGIDGAVYFNGSSTYNFATLSGTTYTLTRDIFGTQITVYDTITVITAGYRIFATEYIVCQGTSYIHNNGSNASGTTAGAGGLGGFFKAGGTGATGLLAASAGAAGTAQATPTANTWVGGLGGKGAMGRAGTTTFTGGMITTANTTVPADVDGGNRVTSNHINYLTRYIVGATNWQMTPSIGGGSGAKSIIGTTATSGGGGGGGGIVFLAAPTIQVASGKISADGGTGGNAAGTGGNFGGGGGGGGGIVAYVCKTDLTYCTAYGGAGGTSVIGTNGTFPVATAEGTLTTVNASNQLVITPTQPLTKGNLYIMTFHLNITGGISGSGINSITSGYGITWYNAGLRTEFNSIASPTRVIEVWYGIKENGNYFFEPDLIDDETITVNLSNANTAQRVILDEIQNVNETAPLTGNNATNRADSVTTLTVTLPNAPTAGNLVYSVFARSGGTATTAGAGNTLVNNQTTAPQISSQVSSAQQANIQTHTTAAAVAGISIEINKSSAGANGSYGWGGKVIRLYG